MKNKTKKFLQWVTKKKISFSEICCVYDQERKDFPCLSIRCLNERKTKDFAYEVGMNWLKLHETSALPHFKKLPLDILNKNN